MGTSSAPSTLRCAGCCAPAPDLAGLALKLELAAREAAWELTGAETCIATLAREARRLARI